MLLNGISRAREGFLKFRRLHAAIPSSFNSLITVTLPCHCKLTSTYASSSMTHLVALDTRIRSRWLIWCDFRDNFQFAVWFNNNNSQRFSMNRDQAVSQCALLGTPNNRWRPISRKLYESNTQFWVFLSIRVCISSTQICIRQPKRYRFILSIYLSERTKA